jgi:hypothetical protein
MHQPARRTGIRIVIDREDAAIRYNAQTKWIPKTNCHASQPATIERALKDRPSAIFAGEVFSIGANKSISNGVVLAQADEQLIAAGREGDSAETVVRIIVRCFETQDFILLIGNAVMVGVAQQNDVVPSHQVNRPVVPDHQVHRVSETFGKRAPAVEPAIAIGIGEHPNTVTRWTLVFLGPLMRMRLDNEQATLSIERHTNGRYNLRLAGDEFQLVTVVRNPRLARFTDPNSENEQLRNANEFQESRKHKKIQADGSPSRRS